MQIKKILLIVIGFLVLALGFIGIFFPVLPTTPFVLLAAACFSASSPKLASSLKKNKYFGSYIENYENKTGVPKKIIYRTLIFLWTGLILSIILIGSLIMLIVLILIGIGVSIHLLSLKRKIN